MIRRITHIFFPIHREEIRRFICMGLMLAGILFNYNILRILKDSLIVPNIGAEAIGFIKMYVMTPVALGYMVLYTYLVTHFDFNKIFHWAAVCFLVFFLAFTFILYPYHNTLHPSPEYIEQLIQTKFSVLGYTFGLERVKWFLRIYGHWTFCLFYIVAELWGSVMIFTLFWPFANKITKTEEAKRLYPMYGFIGHIGSATSGFIVQALATSIVASSVIATTGSDYKLVVSIMLPAIAALCLAWGFFTYLSKSALNHGGYLPSANKKPEEIRVKMPLKESFKLILSSRYLGLILIVMLSYGISINVVEGVWKDKASRLYPDTNHYAVFGAQVAQWTGVMAMAVMLLSPYILRTLGWFVGALITPAVMFFTGALFFVYILLGDSIHQYIPLGATPLAAAVFFGTLQNVFTKGTKYALFDITKEMTYIPANDQIRYKGKAAVDVVGQRWAKSGGALIQSTLFMIFPAATYDSLAVYFMAVFFVIVVIWIYDLCKLKTAYERKLTEHNH